MRVWLSYRGPSPSTIPLSWAGFIAVVDGEFIVKACRMLLTHKFQIYAAYMAQLVIHLCNFIIMFNLLWSQLVIQLAQWKYFETK